MKIDALNTSIRPITYEPPVRTDAVRGVDDKDPAQEQQKKTEEAREQKENEAAAVNSAVYGNVLSKDEDGDTLAAKQQALDALEDGMVFVKEQSTAEKVAAEAEKPSAAEKLAEEEAKEAEKPSAAEKLAEEEAKEAKDEKAQAQSLTGVSAQQLETMYLQGKISRYQYDQEIGRRDVLMEKEEKTVGQAEEEEDEKKETNPASAEQIRKEIENNNGFNERMSKLAAATAEEEIRGDAILKAGENDRVDLMNQVFGTN
ncbi:MAG: hypothetical protein IKR47_04595 [Lachnospiraceae bacterium]|nr:hypothetical protein [Lachnospiraceae bacterium]